MLNESGGEIKGTPAELLEQSSTKAGILTVDFFEGKHDIPSCYYEFARRYPDDDGKIIQDLLQNRLTKSLKALISTRNKNILKFVSTGF